MLLTAISVIFIFGLVIFVHELGHFLAARKVDVKVEKFSLGFGPKLLGFKRGDTEYILSAIPLGGYVKLAGEREGEEDIKGANNEFLSKSVGHRAVVITAGALTHYIFGFLMLSLVFFIGSPTLTSRIGGIIENMPAAASGLKAGDKIVTIDGKPVVFWKEMQEIVQQSSGQALRFLVEREEEHLEFTIIPVEKTEENIFGEEIKVGLIGITQSNETVPVKYGAIRAFQEGGKGTLFITTMTYKVLWEMLRGKASPKSLTGPVGIIYLTGQVAKSGLVSTLQWIGLLSVALAIFNILPIPILDGGHLLFLSIEKLRGRPLSQKIRETAEQVSFFFLIALILFISYQDMGNFGLFDKLFK